MNGLSVEVRVPVSITTELANVSIQQTSKIYRAILEDTSDPSKIQAVLPDYGFSITTELANVSIQQTSKIYRAILEDTSDPNKIQAVLPDYGFSITTELANVSIQQTSKIYRAILEDTSDPNKIQAVLPDYGFSITTELANVSIQQTSKIYRAILEDTSDPSKIQAVLPDYGFSITTELANIYRAILEDTSDPNNIQAVLPDYGFSITTELANLMILPTELSVYYYQSLQCGLNNYTADSKQLMTLDQVKEKLTGNKFIIYIDHVDGIKLISTLYEVESGKKVAIFEPDEGAYEEVIQLCTRAVFNYNFGMAYIAHAESLNEFYLQKSSDTDRIAALLDELFKFYEEGTPEALESFEPDTLCAAKSSDGNWYRATVVGTEDTGIKVQFADYGNAETVPKDSVKKLHPQFFEPCALALAASLGLVQLQDDALSKLLEWTTDKEVQVTLAFGTDGWLASLHLDGVDLSMKLVNEKLATPQVSSEETKPEEAAAEPISLPPGCTQVYISHIDTPGHFWLQMADKVAKIEEIQAELQANAGTYPDVENRDLGTLCVAKYLADDQWYRAEILDADSDITTVRFTDYGNTDVLDNQPGLIKVIPDHLKEIERYALKSSVNAVPTGTGEWSEAASEYFNQLVGEITDAVDALIVLKDVTTYVDIFVNGSNITDKLVSEGYAAKSEEPECGGDLPSCFASHINSPSEFWIQLETATPELQSMEAAMVDAENFPELTEKVEGVICAAKYPEDGAWYRAQVIVDGSEGTEVLFMDYGNASIANELRSLPDELKARPALSRKCALQKPRDIKSWSRKSEEKFNELAAEGATIFNVQFIASGDISIVELYLEGKSVTEELVGLCEAQPAAERPTPVGQDSFSSGKICYVNSLDEFYVQLDDFAAEIDKILDRMTGAADFEAAAELKVGSLCAAFWDEDEQWYRAKILEFCEGGYHVLFIDYGNKAKCEEFRQLPEDMTTIEPAAKCCRLTGFGDDAALAEAAKNQLDDYAAEALTFQIEFLDSTKEPALVRLYLDGKDIASMISAKPEQSVKAEATSDVATEKVEQEVKSADATVVESTPEDNTVEKPLETVSTEVVKEKEEPANITREKAEETKTTEADSQEEKEELKPKDEDVTSTDIPKEKEEIKEISVPEDVKESPKETVEEITPKDTTDSTLDPDTSTDVVDETGELNTSQTDLNESIESNNTVVENKSFEAKEDGSSTDEFADANDATLPSPGKDNSTETLENSNETIKTPERDDSKDSLNTDTGYTSDHEKMSPLKDESASPVKTSDSPKKEAEPTGDKTDAVTKIDAVKEAQTDITKIDDEKVEEKVVNKTELKSAE
ncbi:tudor domain-containing protein [Phthorimaea operculella]|nr:tudor domain-containing protein [Phthorimaea operculella]